ncbi:MAG: polysaccharide deacetylase family protein [Bacteroidota bacterium]
MYHKVSTLESKGLTIASDRLEAQFRFLAENNYRSYHFSELANLQKLPQKKNVVITFDDGYVSQLELAVPLLQKYKLKATFFIPLKYIGGADDWNEVRAPIMDADTLRSLDPMTVALAYHSYAHRKYDHLSPNEIETDTLKAFEAASENVLPLGAYLAYPYGKFPRKEPQKIEFFQQLEKHQFVYGLRIGNRLNTFPFRDPFEIQRIDVKGQWKLKKFKRKLKYGNLI